MPEAPDPIPISALQHLVFCERQCALIHIEGLWAENRLTVEGRVLHKNAHNDDPGPRGGGRHLTRPGVRIVRGLALASEALGLIGKADIVEFHTPAPGGTALRAASAPEDTAPSTPIARADFADAARQVPFPIEYKRGRPKAHDADKVQLCAQALCLEEMLAVAVPAGALFYGTTRRRQEVNFDAALRAKTLDAISRLRALLYAGVTYFSVFNSLLRPPGDAAGFEFGGRNRRPPRDRVNALLSFLYAMLAHDARSACETVGLDPAVGFLHTDRPGRPGLALDLMEEFRAFLADRLAVSLVNLGQVKASGFTLTESGAVEMSEATRKEVVAAYQRRKQETITHPFLQEKTTIGLLIHLQARLLARHLRGDLDAYPPFFWK